MTRFDLLAATSQRVGATTRRTDKVAAIAEALAALAPDEIEPAVDFLIGRTPHGRVGIGWATLGGLDRDAPPADEAVLTIGDVVAAIDELVALGGTGVVRARRTLLERLFARAVDRERRLLVAILGGELRQGALDGVMTAAIARAAGVPVADVRRAAMMSGDLATAARVALTGGSAALAAIDLAPLRPVLPMLASPATDLAAAMESGAPTAIEWKLDGARIQVHRRGHDVRVFTRNLNDVTDRLPGVVDATRRLRVDELVLDGEVLGLDGDGAPRAFQDTMSEFGTHRPGVLLPHFFDVLHAGGEALHGEPLTLRRAVLHEIVPVESRLPSIVTASVEEATAFLDAAIRAGHEGVMVKDLEQPYAAGRRGAAWRKVKPVHTFDLVVLAVEWGHGRRTGWLSNLHLGALAGDDVADGFVMVGKTFKGLTDELLKWQTARFLDLEIGRERHVVHVRPEQVVEVAIDGVQRSSRYPGGIALRFARVRRYRDDKPAAAADGLARLASLLPPR